MLCRIGCQLVDDECELLRGARLEEYGRSRNRHGADEPRQLAARDIVQHCAFAGSVGEQAVRIRQRRLSGLDVE